MAISLADIDILGREYFSNTIQQYLIFFGIVFGFLVLSKITDYLVKFALTKASQKTHSKIDDVIIHSISGPIVIFIVSIGLYAASHILYLPETLRIGYNIFVKVLLEVSLTWFVLRFLDGIIIEYVTPITRKTESDLDDHLLPFARNIVKTIVILIATIMIMSDLGFNVTALVASLGVGGIAIGLAAKDFAANLLGGLVIVFDKPFTLGDKIDVGGDKGIVRNIALRYTEIEIADRSKKIIPNAKFLGTTIHNLSYKYKN